MTRALIVIDPQNDYRPDGKFPPWNADAVFANLEKTILRAKAPFFNEGPRRRNGG